MSKRNIDEAYDNERLALANSAQEAAADIGSMLRDMTTVVKLISDESNMTSLADMKLSTAPEKIHKLIEKRSYISQLASTVSPTGNIYIFSDELKFMIDTNQIYIDMDHVLTPEMWENAENDPVAESIASGEVAYQGMKYDVFAMPYGDSSALAVGNTVYIKSRMANICSLFVITSQQIAESMAGDDGNEYAVYYRDQPIACTLEGALESGWLDVNTNGEATDGSGGRWMVSSALSEDNVNVKVVALRSWQTISGRVSYIINSMALLIMAVSMMTIMLAIALAYVNNKPFDKLLTMLFGDEVAQKQIKYDWRIVNDAVRSLLTDNKSLRQEMQHQNESLRHSLMYGLLSGSQIDRRTILGMLPVLGMQMSFDGWAVLIVCDDRSESVEPLYVAMLIRKLLDRHFSSVCEQICLDALRSMILIKGEVKEHDLRRAYEAFSEEMARMTGVATAAAAVRISSMEELADAYVTAQILTGMGEAREIAIVNGRDGLTSRIVYPVELSEQLRRAIREGDSESMLDCMEEMRRRYAGADAAALNGLARAVCVDIGSVLIRLEGLPDGVTERTLKEISELSVSNPISCVSRIPYALESLMAEIRAMRQRSMAEARTTGLGRSIMDFIDSNMTDSELSLSMLAAQFGLSESYISELVKNETGSGFVAYCEEHRVALACEELSRGASVLDAGSRAGYHSPHTFRRVFKKVMGINPSEYGKARDGSAEEPPQNGIEKEE